MKIPNRDECFYFFSHLFVLTILFCIFYGTTNYLASQRTDHLELYLNFEKNIPFFPSWILIYFSINLIFFLPLFYLHPMEMRLLSICFSLITIVASICFILLPARLGYLKPMSFSIFHSIYQFLYTIEYPHNLFPSLHVSYSALIFRFLFPKAKRKEKFLFIVWFILLVLSVLFTHQHHIFDIFSGLLLTYLVLKLAFYGERKGWRFFRMDRA
ncbi:phosphatase PAP2 family protein [Leptospira brenneri]|nr:hypothetical protein CH361_18345 [Leptospira brenneri]